MAVRHKWLGYNIKARQGFDTKPHLPRRTLVLFMSKRLCFSSLPGRNPHHNPHKEWPGLVSKHTARRFGTPRYCTNDFTSKTSSMTFPNSRLWIPVKIEKSSENRAIWVHHRVSERPWEKREGGEGRWLDKKMTRGGQNFGLRGDARPISETPPFHLHDVAWF